MDTTPIYNELQEKLIDPEEDNWGPSSPPEFASSLAQQAEPAKSAESDEPGTAAAQHSSAHASTQQAPTQSSRSGAASRAGGRRHRAEE